MYSYMNKFDLNKTIDPVTPDELVEKYWEKDFLHLTRNNSDYYKSLFNISDVEDILATTASKPEFAVTVVDKSTGTVKTAEPRPTANAVMKSFREGSTIKIMDLGRFNPNIKHLENDIRNYFNTDIAINMYLTPPNSQGFKYHYDRHDVFILQIEGSKDWKIYEPPVKLPIEKVVGRGSLFKLKLPFDDEYGGFIDLSGKKVNEIRIQSGDMFFIPRGFIHEAKTSGELSMHLTVGLYEITWYEALINTLAYTYPHNELLRKSLPPRFANRLLANDAVADEIDKMSKEISSIIPELITPERIKQAVDNLASRFVYASKPPVDGIITENAVLDDVTLDTEVRIRPELNCKTVLKDEQLYLLYSGKYLELPARTGEMLDYMMQKNRFKIGSIQTKLNDDSKLTLVKHLLKNGFLTLAK